MTHPEPLPIFPASDRAIMTGGCLSQPNWVRRGFVSDAGPGWITITYDNDETQTLKPGTGDWTIAIGHRVGVTQRGTGQFITYRIEIATLGIAEGDVE